MPTLDPRSKRTTLILAAIQECKCGTRIDVSRFEAFQELTCPGCAGLFVVQGQVDPAFGRPDLAQAGLGAANPAEAVKRARMLKIAAVAGVSLLVIVAAVVKVQKMRAREAVSPIPELPSAALAAQAASAKDAAPARPAAAAVPAGVYKLKNRQTGQVVDVYAWNSNKDALIKTWPGGTGVNQRWMIRPLGGGYQLVAYHSCKALEVVEGLPDDAAVRQGVLSGADNQIWTFEPVGDGFHRVVSKKSGKALFVQDVTAHSGAMIGQLAPADSHDQHWKLESLGALPADLNPILEGRPLGNPPPPTVAKQAAKPDAAKFVPINLASVANCDSRTGTFSNPQSVQDTVRPLLTGWVEAGGVVFDVPDAATASTGNDLLIMRGGMGPPKSKYPKKVEVPVDGARLTKLHFLGGVGGWGYPWDKTDKHVGVLAAQVTVVRKGGAQQVLQFRNGIEFADYHYRVDVPGSAYVEGFADYQRQARFFSKQLSGTEPVEKVIIESFETNIAPVFIAITGEVAK